MTLSATDELLDALARRGVLAAGELEEIASAAGASARGLELALLGRGVPKHELLHCLEAIHGRPFLEFDESVAGCRELVKRIDPAALRNDLWFPLSMEGRCARVVAWDPGDPAVVEAVDRLGAERVDFFVALPSDVVRIIEHNLDLNPGFPRSSGRTPLAKVRTFLAERRSLHACTRTSLARGRTGLAILRTGLSFLAIALVLHRVLGVGVLSVLALVLAAAGAFMTIEGVRWYLPARRSAGQRLACAETDATNGTTVLEASCEGGRAAFSRSEAVAGAAELRAGWSDLSPVMRRRFLASDRTDLAEERTFLACLRTRMARARTGLAFTRTGIAFVGLGVALLRIPRFQGGWWPLFDGALVAAGAAMMLEGLLHYLLDRRAGAEGDASVHRANDAPTVWQAFFPPRHERPELGGAVPQLPPLAMSHAPGIWGTTGLALERTMLAERRNVMARLRTVMARSRTGLAFVRTGMSTCAVGIALLAYFGISSAPWAAVYLALVAAGGLFVADGLYWHLPAERLRRQLPYCFCDLEIAVPDYGTPARSWGKAVFSHEDV